MYAKCFYYKARRRMQNAQILVVNHALFFTDLALRRENVSILPKYDVVIFDEAHTLEAVAGDHLGPEHHQRPGRIHAAKAVQRSDQSRAAGASQAARRPERGVGMPRSGGRFLRERRRLAGRAAKGQRPGPPAGHRGQSAQRRSAKARRPHCGARPSRSNSPSNGRTSPPRPTGWRRSPRASTIGSASRWPTRSIGSTGGSAAAGCGSRWPRRRSTWGRAPRAPFRPGAERVMTSATLATGGGSPSFEFFSRGSG